MEMRLAKDYPLDITPEHDKRNNEGSEVSAAYDYVESVLDTSDFIDSPAWHGWAIREAFLAGASHAKTQN